MHLYMSSIYTCSYICVNTLTVAGKSSNALGKIKYKVIGQKLCRDSGRNPTKTDAVYAESPAVHGWSITSSSHRYGEIT